MPWPRRRRGRVSLMYRVGERPAEATDAEETQGRSTRRAVATIVGVAAVVAFVVAVVGSASRSSVPAGSSTMGSMGGMSMTNGGPIDFTARDVDGRRIALPGSRPGAIVVLQSGACAPCLQAIRRLAAAARRVPGAGLSLTALSVQADDDRASLRRVADAAGDPPMRYLVDDRNGMLAGMLDVSRLGTIIVYDARGARVPIREESVAGVADALARASG